MEYIITRQSITNRCNTDGRSHLDFTEKERPCVEAYLKRLKDKTGDVCTRYFIEIESSIEAVDRLGELYDSDILITKNLNFNNVISLVIYDEKDV